MKKVQNILKAFIALLLVGLMTFQSSKEMIFFGLYTMFQEVIVQEYCVNINKPEMMCNAKCYINKILTSNEANDNDSNDYLMASKTHPTNYIVEELFVFDMDINHSDRVCVKPVFRERFYSSIDNNFIFQPPRV